MSDEEKMAVGLGTATTLSDSVDDSTDRRSKTTNILRIFVSGQTLNRFDAERHNDHCLNSTVSSLQREGIVIDRAWETVPCLGGRATVRVKRYGLNPAPGNLAKAQSLLASWEVR